MPEVPWSPSVKRDLLLGQMSPWQQLSAAHHCVFSRRVPASPPPTCTTRSAAPLGPHSCKELPWLLAHGLLDFGRKLQLFQF